MQYKIKTSMNINLVRKAICAITFLSIFTLQAQMNKIDGVEVVIGKILISKNSNWT